jgi:Fe2+ transport system protein FeoA
MQDSALTLCDLSPRERATVVEVRGADALAARLMEMGLLPGEVVEMVGRAPMGDPIEYAVYGYRISLRAVEAARVRIDRAP